MLKKILPKVQQTQMAAGEKKKDNFNSAVYFKDEQSVTTAPLIQL